MTVNQRAPWRRAASAVPSTTCVRSIVSYLLNYFASPFRLGSEPKRTYVALHITPELACFMRKRVVRKVAAARAESPLRLPRCVHGSSTTCAAHRAHVISTIFTVDCCVKRAGQVAVGSIVQSARGLSRQDRVRDSLSSTAASGNNNKRSALVIPVTES